MAWSKEQVQRLLDQVASTNGHESAQKSKELLSYVASGVQKGPGDRATAQNSEPAADTGTLRARHG